jgi:membrane protein DedA with SNARE-associated domain
MTPNLPVDPAAGPWAVVVAIVLATFVSEDLTCVGVGLLIAAGRIGWLPGLAGCFVGIATGDLGVWAIGRVAGRRALGLPWVRRRLPADRLESLADVLARHGGPAAVVSRFLPGTRVPLFLAAGLVGRRQTRFLTWAVVAAAVWTPAVVLTVATFEETVAGPLTAATGSTWPVAVLAVVTGYLALRLGPRLAARSGRRQLAAAVARLWRWEFWPAWVFYLPVVPWYAWLAVRYRGLTVWTAANPGIPAGGVVSESKADILSRLPADAIVPTALVPTGAMADRLDAVRGLGWAFPLILKPDAGQRGAGVRRVWDPVDVEKYLQQAPDPVIVQPYHPGPFEAGVFYYRLPGEPTGRVFSITDKVFPVVIGDGESTVAELIWKHPRYRMQARTFLDRHAADADRVLDASEMFPLALAGNHCQGTLFRDGGHLLTPELEGAIDAVVRSFAGFFFGRLDVRYADPGEFRNGRGFAVIELNGATSESTNLYDPSWPLWRAYRTLFRQWALAFRIGAMNRARGHWPVGVIELLRLIRRHYRERRVSPLSD